MNLYKRFVYYSEVRQSAHKVIYIKSIYLLDLKSSVRFI